MSYRKQTPLLSLVVAILYSIVVAEGATWSIPLPGNVFRLDSPARNNEIGRGDAVRWSDRQAKFGIFFHVNQPAEINLQLAASAKDGPSTLEGEVLNQRFQIDLTRPSSTQYDLATLNVSTPGYVQVNLKGQKKDGTTFGSLHHLIVSSNSENLQVDFVQNNKGNMFYWGRRGPSVHLRYDVPKDRDLQYAYNEITVPEGKDPLGSFFMANGFGEGYFGFQVNREKERRVLFSVWSPYKTNNPNEIPPDQRITALAHGAEVHVGKFGNEGSGGQSYLRYPWVAGKTYRFLTEVRPIGDDYTVYTAWFGDKASDEWRLIASFRRPKTTTHLRGFHSFLESFYPSYGHIERKAYYGNTWVRDTEGQWYPCRQARFSVDATGRGKHRLDYEGGQSDGRFYLRNCGFFSPNTKPGTQFHINASQDSSPLIDLKQLPMK